MSIEAAKEYLIKQLQNLINCEESNLTIVLGDFYTDDIANEWEYSYFEFFLNQLSQLPSYEKICLGMKALCDGFKTVSKNGSKYEEKIWTLEGMKSHPFWVEQKQLAQKLLNELER